MNYDYDSGKHYYIDDGGQRRAVTHDEFLDHYRNHQRVGREQRDRYADHLSDMYSREYLTKAEFDERSAKAAAAMYEFDLTSLVMDLPKLPDKPSATRLSTEENLAQVKAAEQYRQEVVKAVRKPMHPVTAWSLSLLAFLIVLSVPDPIAAHLYGGLGNAPWGFAFPIIVGVLGSVVSLFGTLFAIVDA